VAIQWSADIAPQRRFLPRALRLVTVWFVLAFVFPFVLFVLLMQRTASRVRCLLHPN
jgi:hypothetical protein